MVFALVHYPKVDALHVNQLRRQYDPRADLIAPHITLMSPVPESIGEDNLIHHLEKILEKWQPFPIHLYGLKKSWDNYLFLLIQRGNANIIRLHNEIHTGILAEHRKTDMPFVPHITLGAFDKNLDKYHQALEDARQLGLDYHCLFDTLTLVKGDVQETQTIECKIFHLQTGI